MTSTHWLESQERELREDPEVSFCGTWSVVHQVTVTVSSEEACRVRLKAVGPTDQQVFFDGYVHLIQGLARDDLGQPLSDPRFMNTVRFVIREPYCINIGVPYVQLSAVVNRPSLVGRTVDLPRSDIFGEAAGRTVTVVQDDIFSSVTVAYDGDDGSRKTGSLVRGVIEEFSCR